MGASWSGMGKYAWWLMIIGALNWGLMGLGDFLSKEWNVINLAVGQWPQLESAIYLLIGLSAVYLLSGKFSK